MAQLPKIVAIGAVVLALLASATGYGISSCQRRHDVAETDARAARRTLTKASADSAYFFDAGRRYELQRQLDQLTDHAETLPGLPALPADPPRQ